MKISAKNPKSSVLAEELAVHFRQKGKNRQFGGKNGGWTGGVSAKKEKIVILAEKVTDR